MSLQTIAHYNITGKLGEGGMGEVYRAIDTKLGHEVAIKVIPEAFAQDASRMARFTREAQVLASLNHPNIGAIYGVALAFGNFPGVASPSGAGSFATGAATIAGGLFAAVASRAASSSASRCFSCCDQVGSG